MCGNRVEELEEQVQQLQATVDGLTDELVECKVRIRELESAVDTEPTVGAPPDPEESDEEPEPPEESAESDNSEAPEGSDEPQTESESDIIIA